MFNDLSSPASLLATRRSGKARNLIAPGPDDAQLKRILAAGNRTPDHGKMAPWRFVVIAEDQRAAFADVLARARAEEGPQAGPEQNESDRQFAFQAPTLIVAVSTPSETSVIPVWEQELSSGAACMNLLHAAHAEGFVGNWLTGWAAYSRRVRDTFTPSGRIAGFIFVGTPSRPLKERPRPASGMTVHAWIP